MVGEVDATTASGIHGLADENEDIRVHVVSREQAYQWVEEGENRQRSVGHRFAMAAAASSSVKKMSGHK